MEVAIVYWGLNWCWLFCIAVVALLLGCSDPSAGTLLSSTFDPGLTIMEDAGVPST